MSNRSFFKETITGGRTKRKERVQSIDRLEAGPREGIRKGNLRVSKSRHNTLSKNENNTKTTIGRTRAVDDRCSNKFIPTKKTYFSEISMQITRDE